MYDEYMPNLLSRDDFRNGVFARDKHKCVFCDAPAVDAHHIIERRLFADGGYYLDNGISVCEEHHLACERTDISVEDARHAAGITKIVVPEHLYGDTIIDKWGNPILPNGRRMKGELFYDESVQKIIDSKLPLFDDFVKYPRTWHLPWSQGLTKDDRVLKDCSCFEGREVVVTEKMDGENTTVYNNYIHARSIDGRNHESRNWVKNMVAKFQFEIPQNHRIVGENLYAKHSIAYSDLPSYFLGFSMWNNNICMSWDETLEWFSLLEIDPVKVLYRGIFDESIIKGLWDESERDIKEGYVIRLTDAFLYGKFKESVAKFVRKNHVHTHGHWMREAITPNKLK